MITNIIKYIAFLKIKLIAILVSILNYLISNYLYLLNLLSSLIKRLLLLINLINYYFKIKSSK